MRIAQHVAGWCADLVDLLLPGGCVACGNWIPEPHAVRLVCGSCRARLPRAPWPRCPRCHLPLGTGRSGTARCRECADWPDALDHARFATVLAPPADKLVHALKYGGWAELAREMGRTMASLRLPAAPAGASRLVVPVPTTRERVRERGYNQAELLARSVAETLDIPFLEGLVRVRGGATQVALPPSQRRANVKGAFAARGGEAAPRIEGAHVVLVDDVLTTGSTAGAAASELVRMGASEVTLLVYARAMPFRADEAR